MDWYIYSAVVLCAADGCDHLDCHGGPFRVVVFAGRDSNAQNVVDGMLARHACEHVLIGDGFVERASMPWQDL
jgi:hypothetical protein